MIIQGSHAPCSIPYHTFFPYRMLIGKLMDPLNKRYVRTHSSPSEDGSCFTAFSLSCILIGEIGITTLGLDDTDFISIIITGHDIAENQLLNSKFGTKSLTICGIKHCIL